MNIYAYLREDPQQTLRQCGECPFMNIYNHKFLIFKHSRPSSCDSVVLRRQIVLDDDFFAAAVNTTSDQSAPGTNSLELIPPLRFTSVCICDSGHVRVTFQSSWPTVDPRRGSAFLPQSISDAIFFFVFQFRRVDCGNRLREGLASEKKPQPELHTFDYDPLPAPWSLFSLGCCTEG